MILFKEINLKKLKITVHYKQYIEEWASPVKSKSSLKEKEEERERLTDSGYHQPQGSSISTWPHGSSGIPSAALSPPCGASWCDTFQGLWEEHLYPQPGGCLASLLEAQMANVFFKSIFLFSSYFPLRPSLFSIISLLLPAF